MQNFTAGGEEEGEKRCVCGEAGMKEEGGLSEGVRREKIERKREGKGVCGGQYERGG